MLLIGGLRLRTRRNIFREAGFVLCERIAGGDCDLCQTLYTKDKVDF
jgi:hypothetical protein